MRNILCLILGLLLGGIPAEVHARDSADVVRKRLLSTKKGILSSRKKTRGPDRFGVQLHRPSKLLYKIAFQSEDQYRIQVFLTNQVPVLTVVNGRFYLFQYRKRRFLTGTFSRLRFQCQLLYDQQTDEYRTSIGFFRKEDEQKELILFDFDSFLRRQTHKMKSKDLGKGRVFLSILSKLSRGKRAAKFHESRFLIQENADFPYREIALGYVSDQEGEKKFTPYVLLDQIAPSPDFHPDLFTFPDQELRDLNFEFMKLRSRPGQSPVRKSEVVLRQIRNTLQTFRTFAQKKERLQKLKKMFSEVESVKGAIPENWF